MFFLIIIVVGMLQSESMVNFDGELDFLHEICPQLQQSKTVTIVDGDHAMISSLKRKLPGDDHKKLACLSHFSSNVKEKIVPFLRRKPSSDDVQSVSPAETPHNDKVVFLCSLCQKTRFCHSQLIINFEAGACCSDIGRSCDEKNEENDNEDEYGSGMISDGFVSAATDIVYEHDPDDSATTSVASVSSFIDTEHFSASSQQTPQSLSAIEHFKLLFSKAKSDTKSWYGIFEDLRNSPTEAIAFQKLDFLEDKGLKYAKFLKEISHMWLLCHFTWELTFDCQSTQLQEGAFSSVKLITGYRVIYLHQVGFTILLLYTHVFIDSNISSNTSLFVS